MTIIQAFQKKSGKLTLATFTILALSIGSAYALDIHAKNQTSSAKNSAQATSFDGIDFGDNSSEWASDGECDDPRFEGPGTAVDLLEEDMGHDANDCMALYQASEISLKPEPADIIANIDFGDNSSEWSYDNECDDPRFGGPGTDDVLLDEDMGHDANDCKALFLSGDIQYLGDDPNMTIVNFDGIVFGDNTSQWNSDGECDDPRFAGPGMATQLVEEDLQHDAVDCLALYKSGSITLAGDAPPPQTSSSIDFGDNSSEWANDNECDDPRFAGEGVAGILLDSDLGHDANDCRTLYENGSIYLAQDNSTPSANTNIDFGDDNNQYANDGECDDPRFAGPGVASVLLDQDLGHDASDCRMLFENGTIYLAGATPPLSDDIFGDDTSNWSNDRECDDPRFIGNGMAAQLAAVDMGRDATDCRALFEAGQIALINASNVDFGDDASRWPNDGECDDPRFAGEGTAMKLDPAIFGHDATDCQALMASGSIQFIGGILAIIDPNDMDQAPTQSGGGQSTTNIDWGDDASTWSNDGECDDPRFTGPGSAEILLDEDLYHDATDCQALYNDGQIEFAQNSGLRSFHNSGFVFGDNTSEYANNEICDDPRFAGPGVDPILLAKDEGHDANDCKALFSVGQVSLATDFLIDFGDNGAPTANNGQCDDARFAGKAMAQTFADEGIGHDASDCRSAFSRGKIYFGEDGRIDFGDNSSEWSNDNECDDPRFGGPGVAANPEQHNISHDANDCRTLYQSAQIYLAPDDQTMFPINFGDNSSEWSNDGECDDPRFFGPGSADEPVFGDLGHDAADCAMLIDVGQIEFGAPLPANGKQKGQNTDTPLNEINYGDNTSEWANDGECDDPRFSGPGAADILLEEDRGHDAADCQSLLLEGQVQYEGETIPAPPAEDATDVTLSDITDINFGDDTSGYANNNICDDPRFEGEGVDAVLLAEDLGHDATDCSILFGNGQIQLIGQGTTNDTTHDTTDIEPFSFGDNSSIFANDGECDDDRFEGAGMAPLPLYENHRNHDANDCLAAFETGQITMISGNGTNSAPTQDSGNTADTDPNIIVSAHNIIFGDNTSPFARDVDCDDPRFTGPGAVQGSYPVHIEHDGDDCLAAFEAGQITLIDQETPFPSPPADDTSDQPDSTDQALDFGDDTSLWANDGECDDPRFEGEGVAAQLVDENQGHDATDCKALFDAEKITLITN